MVVDLPAPDLPTRPIISPGLAVKVRPFSTGLDLS